ncbi:pimeloyl-ACP methyl ester carboxylesterase [Kitasatospora sp. MAP12-15]|uniref:alpha/beta hydrolase n=1 Tax=unclassified Kitasatospora TaxID=2633591 RepID=UPI00247690AF|nr:alpha/beta hydrolase [Kitasatospora sp. MAP12-44]MDH6111449.1 pimeloyl-ACP methyl ester carboxylesterase [Kitasatospora sp. MAP12-44]
MRPVRRHRTTVAARTASALLAAGLMLAGCTSAHPGAAKSPKPSKPDNGGPISADGTPAASTAPATPLEPLPAAIPADLASYYAQQLTWQPCDQRFECATFKVPLDYAHPAGGDLSLSAVRQKASGDGSAQRLGSLLLNPGGPGGSAIEYVESVAGSYDPKVRAAYDLVGLDPRGVGRSSPVSCLSGDRMDAYTAVDSTPDDPAKVAQLVAADKEFAAACEQHSGSLLGHVSTVEAARDMDVLRALLGDPKLAYVGKSYGTLLGATYAGLFPSRVGRLVLDGAVDPALDALTSNRTQAGGFETAWAAFAQDCVKRDDCPIGSTEQQAGQQLDALFGKLDATALNGDGARKLTKSQAVTGVIEAMYAEFLWPQLRAALKSAQSGDGGPLLKLSDDYYERASDGSYPNLMFANMAVNCLDEPAPFANPDEVARAVPDFEKASPHFGRDMAWMALSCAYWPVKPTGGAHTVRAAGAAPIVVVGTTRDPATPYAWAQSLAGQLESGRLLTYDGDGHTAYGRHNDCVDSAVNQYLLAGTAPAQGLRCSK